MIRTLIIKICILFDASVSLLGLDASEILACLNRSICYERADMEKVRYVL